MTKVKICGIKTLKDVEYINEALPDFAGFVMFFEKSKRCISPETALELLEKTDPRIKRVAVSVSPSMEQLEAMKRCGFDYAQIHGEVSPELIEKSPLPVIRAFNIVNTGEYEQYVNTDNIKGFLFDSKTPGSGKTFDWSKLNNIPRGGKFFILAGGLTPENVAEAVREVRPDGVDVSSGVECENGGKSRRKILDFVKNARNA